MCWFCWPFVDAWLEDPIAEASKHSKHHTEKIDNPPRAAKSFNSSKRASVPKDATKFPKQSEKSSKPSKKSQGGNDWIYVPEPPPRAKSTSKSLKPQTSMAGSDYEHWADEASTASKSPKSSKSLVMGGSTVVTGYDGYNGLRKYTYHITDIEKKDEKKDEPKDEKKPEECVCAPPPPAAQQQVYYMMSGYPPPQYMPYPQHMAYPAPAYYGFPPPNYPGMPYNGVQPMCFPTPAAMVEGKKEVKKEEKKEKKKPEVKKWQGRTKAEVEEDNMKIAMKEGDCDARKVEPKGLKEDQMVWCVEVDGSHTLRAFAAIKEFKGEWKADPRFKDSWYFVREEEKAE